MISEAEVPAEHRFLLCNYSFSGQLIETIKADVTKFMEKRNKTALHQKFINWQQQENEIAVLTMYAYADIPLPKHFDTVFQIDNPQNYAHTDFSITQVVINGWMAMEEIEHGHKHIAILEFRKEVPKIMNLLSDYSITDLTNHSIELGFCNRTDFGAISQYLNSKKEY